MENSRFFFQKWLKMHFKHNLLFFFWKKRVENDLVRTPLPKVWNFPHFFFDGFPLLMCRELQMIFCEAQARVRQGWARDGSQGERPQSLTPCLELT